MGRFNTMQNSKKLPNPPLPSFIICAPCEQCHGWWVVESTIHWSRSGTCGPIHPIGEPCTYLNTSVHVVQMMYITHTLDKLMVWVGVSTLDGAWGSMWVRFGTFIRQPCTKLPNPPMPSFIILAPCQQCHGWWVVESMIHWSWSGTCGSCSSIVKFPYWLSLMLSLCGISRLLLELPSLRFIWSCSGWVSRRFVRFLKYVNWRANVSENDCFSSYCHPYTGGFSVTDTGSS